MGRGHKKIERHFSIVITQFYMDIVLTTSNGSRVTECCGILRTTFIAVGRPRKTTIFWFPTALLKFASATTAHNTMTIILTEKTVCYFETMKESNLQLVRF